ncbi:unnamed protein product [Adineta steineri]|uniref:Uncharacterized protein n=1 Tax=Adineta steineri TaxID=433720 RepID=A0A816BRF2_9BILA|nr:unnamed protein product [Adineta steineri]CAF1612876.1 unnamed protein product [Adineta steineri]
MHHQEFITKSAEEILLDETELLTTTNKQVTTTNTNKISKTIFNNGTSAGILGGKENQSGRIRVILNEGSTAGVLEPVNGCTRLLMTEEGNVVLTRVGAGVTGEWIKRLIARRA